MGFVTSLFLIGSGKSYRAYEELAAGYEGAIDEGKAVWAKKVYEDVSARYGTDSRMIARSIKDQPETMLAIKYNELHASLHGWNAAIQSIPTYAKSMFGFRTWQLAVVGTVWIIFTGTVYSLIIGFVSSRMKSQMGTVGVSLAILFINVGLAAMGDAVTQRFWPLIDFGLANVTLIKEVFGGYKMFHVFGMCVSYPVMAIFVLSLVAALAGVGIYRGQKNRTVA